MLGSYRLAADYLRFQKEFGPTLTTNTQAFCLLPERNGSIVRWFIGPRDDILDWLDPHDIVFHIICAHSISAFSGMTNTDFIATAIKLWGNLTEAGYNESCFRSSRSEYMAAHAKEVVISRSIFTPEPFMAPMDTISSSPILLAMRYGCFTTDKLHTDKYLGLSQLDFVKEFEQAEYADAHLEQFALDRHVSQSPLITSYK